MLAFRRLIEGSLLPLFCLSCGSGPLPGRGEKGLVLCPRCVRRLAPWERFSACRSCGLPLAPGPVGGLLCGACGTSPFPWSELLVGWWYRAPIEAPVRAFKYQGWDFLADALSMPLSEAVLNLEEPVQSVVPVGSSLSRLFRRGYNPPSLLAKAIARLLDLPLAAGLFRYDLSGPQVKRKLAERRVLKARFLWVGSKLSVRGKSVLLVDDVLTTGATAAAAARALLRVGAKRVRLAVVCRTPLNR